MLIQNFRSAAMGHGKYCPAKNELRVRKGRRVYRFTCTERGIRFAAPAQSEVSLYIAPDATVHELRRGISLVIDFHESNQTEF
jgi:hypothetical protein